LSAYMFFSQATRQQIKEENPEASFGKCLEWFSYNILI
jgi:hypothetical protein